MFGLISKVAVVRFLIGLLERIKVGRCKVEDNPDATDQEKRDAFMYAAGGIYAIVQILNMLRGEQDGNEKSEGNR